MENAFAAFIERCNLALDSGDPQASVEAVLLDAARDPDIVDAVAERTKFASLSDLAIHRSERLTLLAGTLPPGFVAAPHDHNLWSVVGPGVLPNGPDVIHAICNPLDEPLLVLHAYGGDLFATPRSNWDPETHEEIPFDWEKVRSKADA